MFLFLFIIWIMLNGRLDGDVLVTGLLAAGGIYAVVMAMSGLSPKKEWRLICILPLLIAYGGVLFWEIIKANCAVIGVIYRGTGPTPRIVHFHSGLHHEAANVLLANSITLTPGTITIEEQNGDFTVHCLMAEYADGLEDSSFLRLLKRMEAIWNR